MKVCRAPIAAFASAAPKSLFSVSFTRSFRPSQKLCSISRIGSQSIRRIRSSTPRKMATRAGIAHQKIEEDPIEAEGRKDAGFLKVESLLFEKLTMAGVSSFGSTALLKLPSAFADIVLGWLGDKNPFVANAKAGQNEVWILDNTGYKASDTNKWQSEIIACFFRHGRGDLTKAAAAVADAIGLDGEGGLSPESQKLIELRLKPFVDAVAPACTLPVVINAQGGKPLKHLLGPSNTSGISSQIFEVGQPDQPDGSVNQINTDNSISNLPTTRGITRLAAPDGFGVISDIDDTIKITQVRPLFETFARFC